jgi:large subunit ribosomal protein L22
MGAKSRNRAEQRKEAKKTLYFAKLNNCPTSPRKMRLVADLVRGQKVEYALHILKNAPQQASERLRKLLLSAIANWQAKNEGVRLEESDLFVKEISVDGGRMLKRLQTAPQGRAHRVRKRSNHVTLIVDSRIPVVKEESTDEVTVKTTARTTAKKTEKKKTQE